MLKPLRSGMVPHSRLSHLAALLPSGAPVCSLTMPLSGGSVGIRIAYSACFKTLPHVLTYTVQYWVVFINMFHTAHPICGMGQCNGPVFATCRLRNLSAGVSEDAGVLENVTYLLVAPDMWHG